MWTWARLVLGGVGAMGLVIVAACSLPTPAAVAASPEGQLFCAIATSSGPIVAALIDAASGGAAVIATNAASALVASECALAGGVPVSPPAVPEAAPVVAIDTTKLPLS